MVIYGITIVWISFLVYEIIILMAEIEYPVNNQTPIISQFPEDKETPSPNKKNTTSKLLIIASFFLLFALGALIVFNFRQKNQLNQILNSIIKPAQITITPTIPLDKPIETSFLRKGNIWLANEDGTNQKQLTKEGNIEDYYWIPKTNKVVFYERIDIQQGTQINIKILNLDNDEERIIHTKIHTEKTQCSSDECISPNYHFSMRVSPDGKKIAYAYDLVDKNLVIYDIDTGEEKEVEAEKIDPVFSPDSQYLAGCHDSNIFIYSLKDNSLKQLTNFTTPKNYSDYRNYESPRHIIGWLQNSNRILYYFGNYGLGADIDKETYHIYSIESTSKNTENLTKSGSQEIDNFLDQSPGSKDIYYLVTKRGTQEKLVKRDIESNQEVDISLSQTASRLLSLQELKISPNGSLVIYEWLAGTTINGRYLTNPEIWEMDTKGANNHKIIDDASNPKWKY